MTLAFWISFAAILGLLILSAFFSGSETAYTAASKARMHKLENDAETPRERQRAAIVNKLHAERERLIGAILLGNNLVNILASALATSVLIVLVGEAGVAIATIFMTLMVLIFAEVLPKTYALRHADRVALAIAPVMRVVVLVLAPVTLAVTGVVRGLLSLFGVKGENLSVGIDPEELRGAIEMHRGEEEEVAHERAMLRSILDLGEVEVDEIMTPRRDMAMIDASQASEKILEEVLASPYTRLPLFRAQGDDIVGVLHAKALLRAVQAQEGDATKVDILAVAAEPWFIPDTTTLLDQLQEFRKRREHFALVVDEYGVLQGLVTLEDILEEIVGEISDEHDLPITGVRHQPDGSFIIDGRVTIRDLNREFEWRMPDEDYATIAGLVLYEAQRLPEPGQVFSFYGFTFEILRRQRNQITLIRVRPSTGEKD